MDPENGSPSAKRLQMESRSRRKGFFRCDSEQFPDHSFSGNPDEKGPAEFLERRKVPEEFIVLTDRLGESESGIENPIGNAGLSGPGPEIPEVLQHFACNVAVLCETVHGFGRALFVHGYVREGEPSDGFQHGGIIFAGGNVVDQKIPDQGMGSFYDGGPERINRDPDAGKGFPDLVQDGSQTLPFGLRTDGNGSRTGRAGTKIKDIRSFFHHLYRPAYGSGRIGRADPAFRVEGIICQIDDSHDGYFSVTLHFSVLNRTKIIIFVNSINKKCIMLVVVEGLDGAGKSTQVAMLKQYLGERCGNLEYIHFPRYDAPVYGSLISRFLRGDFGTNETVHPQLVALLFAEDRHGAGPWMKQVLSEGKTLLLDRYVYSNIAYQCAKLAQPAEREDLREWILNTEFGEFGLPRPDLNIFLDVPIGFVRERLSAQRKGHDRDYLSGAADIHEADISFQETVRSLYMRQVSLDPKFIRIDCSSESGNMLPPEVIFEKIRAVVDPMIKEKEYE